MKYIARVSPAVAALGFALLVCGGCSSSANIDEGSGGAGGDGAGGGADGGGGAAPSSCPSDGACVVDSCGEEACVWDCQLQEPCAQVEFSGSGMMPGPSDEFDTINDMAAAQCALQALRDGEEATVVWSTSYQAIGFGTYTGSHRIHIRPGGLALLRSSSGNLGGSPTNAFSYNKSGPHPLQDSAYFDACLAETEVAALHDCLANAVVPCTAP